MFDYVMICVRIQSTVDEHELKCELVSKDQIRVGKNAKHNSGRCVVVVRSKKPLTRAIPTELGYKRTYTI